MRTWIMPRSPTTCFDYGISKMASNGEGTDHRWDSSFRRDLRHELRESLLETQRNRDIITVPDELLQILHKGNELYERVVSSREAVIDSEHFRLLSEIARRQSQSNRGELIHFDHRVYCEKLLTLMGRSGSLDWQKLGSTFLRSFQVAPTGQFLYGALDPVPVAQKSARAKKVSKSSSVERPRQLSEFEEKEETTTRDVSIIMNTLKKLCPAQEGQRVHYFKFIVDPKSFSRTIENVFHFSFLVKEGRAGIKIENDQPYIYLTTQSNEAGSGHRTNQAIASIDMKTWKMLIDKYDIKEAMIVRKVGPTRGSDTPTAS